jgi:hypothetical protein
MNPKKTRPMTDPATAPPSLLMEFILACLAPLLVVGSITDLTLARQAAAEAIATYKARAEDELLTIAQAAGFAIAALDNLRLSAAKDLSVSLKLKLRGNAAALNRVSQANKAALKLLRRENPEPAVNDEKRKEEALQALAEAEAAVAQAQANLPQANLPQAKLPQANHPQANHPQANPHQANHPTRRADARHAIAWAAAMKDVATECSQNLPRLPPAERRAEIIRINLLSRAAREISQASRKATLLNTTTLDSPAGEVAPDSNHPGRANRFPASPKNGPVSDRCPT